MKNLNAALVILQREMRLKAIAGDIKHLRYIRTAIANIIRYKQIQEQEKKQ